MIDKSKSKFVWFSLIIFIILEISILFNNQLLVNLHNSHYKNGLTIKTSQSTTSIDQDTPYGSAMGGGYYSNKQAYLEWSLNTTYGPGFTWYMMNDTEFWDMGALPYNLRTRENLIYTALLSDEEESASGIFYPQYSDVWWYVSINHYTGYACSVTFNMHWKYDFININEPTSSSGWGINSSQYINWTWGGDFAFVDINLYHNGTYLTNIATNAKNNGSYLWKIPDIITVYDDLYQINISNSEFSKTWDTSDAYFVIEPKAIKIIAPSSIDSLETGYTHIITWESTGFINNMKIELFKDSLFELEITSSTLNDGLFFWTIPSSLENSTQYQIKITDASDSSVYNYSDFFEIYTKPPAPSKTLNITTPSVINSWETKETYQITWTSTGNLTNVKIELFKNSMLELEIVSNTPNDGSYSWIIPTSLENSTKYQIKITDLLNSSVYDYSDLFEIYTPPSATNNPDIPGYDFWILTNVIIVSLIILGFFVISDLHKKCI
ncbi:MAG: Ser-Thr-rich GPI-anchored membrane family protein [Candidatus Odinarchaeota archaeon]